MSKITDYAYEIPADQTGMPGTASTSGDVSGALPGPLTVLAINGIAITGAPAAAGDEIIATSTTAAHWATPPASLSNPMTTQDDIIVGGVPSGGVAPPARLGKGSDGQVLTVDPSTHHLVWATPTGGGMTNPMTTVGDVIVGGTVTGGVAAPARLGVGTANQLLHGGTTPAYSAVLPADLDVTADNTTADATTGHHGLLPKLGGGTTNFLRADGSWQAPPGGSAGALVLLEQHTTTGSSSSLDFTGFSGTYDDYQLELIGLVPATNGDVPWLRFGTGGGPTWDAGANYNWALMNFPPGGSVGQPSGTGQGQIALFNAGVLSTATAGTEITLRIFNPGSSTNHKRIVGQGFNVYSANGLSYMVVLFGEWKVTTAATGIQFLYSTGNIAAGTIRLYGIAK